MKRKREPGLVFGEAKSGMIEVAREAIDFLKQNYSNINMENQYPDLARYPIGVAPLTTSSIECRIPELLMSCLASRLAHSSRVVEDCMVLFKNGRYESCMPLYRVVLDDHANMILLLYLKGENFLKHLIQYAIRSSESDIKGHCDLTDAHGQSTHGLVPAEREQRLEVLKRFYSEKFSEPYPEKVYQKRLNGRSGHLFYSNRIINEKAMELIKDSTGTLPIQQIFSLFSQYVHYGLVDTEVNIVDDRIVIGWDKEQNMVGRLSFPWQVLLFIDTIDRFDDFFARSHKKDIKALWDTAMEHYERLVRCLKKYGAQV